MTILKSKNLRIQPEGKVTIPLFNKIDFYILFCVIALVIIGILAIYSSTYSSTTLVSDFKITYKKQLFIALAGFIIATFVYFFPLKYFYLLAYPLYGISIFSLLLILVIGKTIYGSQSWIGGGIFGIQPSEFSKLATILALSKFISRDNFDVNNFKHLLQAAALVLFPITLIMLQPDLGTALVYIAIFIAVLFWDGLSVFIIFALLSPVVVGFASLLGFWSVAISLGLVIVGLLYFKRDIFISIIVFALNLSSVFFIEFFIKALSPHQIKRIETFIDPMKDPLKSGYNVLQSIVAVGSGGLLGKGYMEGSQTQLRFIPEQWTDFIFCVIGEEFGFIGSFILLLLFFILLYRMLKLANFIKSRFRTNIIIMCFALFLTHIVVNIGMAIGVMPVIGIPLPFVSYGGSSLLTNLIIIGIIMNFYKNRTSYA